MLFLIVSSLSYFNKNRKYIGNLRFINKKYLFKKSADFNKSLIENDQVIVGALIRVFKYNKKGRIILIL